VREFNSWPRRAYPVREFNLKKLKKRKLIAMATCMRCCLASSAGNENRIPMHFDRRVYSDRPPFVRPSTVPAMTSMQ
jgi:hypothetical protein